MMQLSLHFILQDVRVLHNIVDQVAERPLSKSGAFGGFDPGPIPGGGGGLNNDLDDDDDDDEEDQGEKIKAMLIEKGVYAANVLCIWDCCNIWIKTSELCAYIVFDPFTELFITLCIVVNVVFMGADHYNVDYDDIGGM